MTIDELWIRSLGELELQISRPNFLTWLKNSRLVDNKEGDAIVALPNHFAKEWVEAKYGKMILGILRTEDSSIKKISYIVDGNITKKKEPLKQDKEEKQLVFNEFKTDPESGLNPKYNLKTFVVGSSNELAYAAATATIDEIGSKYNPLFIYGGTGLGKTHLIQAIGNEIHKKHKGKHKVKYVSSEKFTNDVIWAIRNKRVEDIKNTYRNADILIIDDIQFIGGKEKTEEEFFHTFNALHENNKQIIISSDRPPRSIPILEERLKSRFEGGMIVDISFPDFETRAAIIKIKLQERKESLEDEIINLIANKVQRNIRELEGIINKIVFHSKHNSSFDISHAEKIMNEVIEQSSVNITPSQIIKAVAEFYEISTTELIGRGRKKEIVEPRQVAMYLLRDMLNMSYPFIAEKLGKRDHTTAIYAFDKISNNLNKDPSFNQKMTMVKELINKS
ncbi:MAG: chromosomal replication initiator protein DnaA [Candidatus Colwellbacteria bacterium]|jgi:chromosomal replication initiator protein|nr:chromosomal replication initiator protein DnaA [Candidatus Colwellbacteria bacterium]MCK9497308.1 chromosomal replication initiator protein DnaA [Candidatus Colwellbacteria bacterium]MDD3752349.1 chromosomal replication initiator protein DnaA [Candidatus Colwellbacteria bacterium]MDD4818584.1 chromosomal replication initiator protein DnaA [Candidatus Colwellbacteria bacterium]